RRPVPRAGTHLLPRAAQLLADGARDPRDRPVRRGPDQDLEQRPDRAPATGAGKAADGAPRRSARQPDQSAFPLQHADVDLVADSIEAGDGADAHREAVGAGPPPPPRPRKTSPPRAG